MGYNLILSLFILVLKLFEVWPVGESNPSLTLWFHSSFIFPFSLFNNIKLALINHSVFIYLVKSTYY